MPIYEFECTSCGDVFDRLQKLSDADPSQCPMCGKSTVKRRLTAPAFRLAGSGWYETDFKKDGDKKRNLAGGDEAPKSDAKEAKHAESKPAESKPADGKAADAKSDAASAKKETAKSEPAAASSASASSKPKADSAP